MLATLLSAALDRMAAVADKVGRLVLYAGLLLVALTDLRLPSNVGGIADGFLAISIVCALFIALRRPRLHFSAFRIHAIGAFFFTLGIVISTTQADQNTSQNLLNLSKFLFTTTFLFLACVLLLKHRSQVRVALGCWVVSVAITSLAAVFQAASGGSLFGLLEDSSGRMFGLTTNPNHLGAVAGVGLVGALSLAVRTGGVYRIVWFVVAILCISGVVLSASRTGAVTAIGALSVWLIVHFRLRREMTLVIAGVTIGSAAIAGYLFVSVGGGLSITDRLSSATDLNEDRAVKSRLAQYDYVLYKSLKSPFVGVGLADKDASVYGVIHNLYLRTFYSGGIISLVGLLIILGDLLTKSYGILKQNSGYETQVVSLATFAGVVGLTLAGMTEPVLYQRQLWVPASLMMASGRFSNSGTAAGAGADRRSLGGGAPRRALLSLSSAHSAQLGRSESLVRSAAPADDRTSPRTPGDLDRQIPTHQQSPAKLCRA